MYRKIVEADPLQGRIIPQKGDPSVTVSQQEITAAFRQAGIAEGDIIMLHSSLSSMGYVNGGADSAVDGILEAVGKKGTFCVPSFWWTPAAPPYEFKEFNVGKSPAFNGIISETVRMRPEAHRSNNPSHAVAGIGADAARITATHGTFGWRPGPYGMTAFAEDSPWEHLYLQNAWYGFLGVEMRVNTMGHYIEHLLFIELYSKVKSKDKETMLNYISRPFYPQQGWWPSFSFLRMGERLEKEGVVRKHKVGSATLRLVPSRLMVDRTLEILHNEPKEWFVTESAKPFLQWL